MVVKFAIRAQVKFEKNKNENIQIYEIYLLKRHIKIKTIKN